ncbi:LuxR C-terminal-related transcriptional regulator [Reyranella sp.]|uniref:helix-turn-helix transcriptional regulator n=1 Tax=Reyranella sp. TaxID=1929291 RepID=UPI003D0EA737
MLDLIYGVVADPDRWPDVLTRVADHLGAVGGMLIHVPRAGSGHVIDIYGRLSEEHGAIFRQHYTWNPWSLAMTGVPFGKAVAVNSLLEPGTLVKTGFYADVLRPQGHVDILNVKHRALSEGGAVGGFGFCLSARGADQADKNLRRFQRLVPHLGRALDGALHLGHLADGTRQLGRVLELMPNPALLLDRKARVILANAAAETLLSTGDGLSTTCDGGLQLVAAFPAETAALSRTLGQALAVAAGANDALGAPLRLTRPSGASPLLVLPVPLPPPVFEFWSLLEPARALVLIVDPAALRRVKTSAIQAAFELTLAEARVAALVSGGLSGPQAADALGLSLSTVKTHLRRCFEKTGTHSKVELALLLGSLPDDAAGRPG